MSQLLLEKLGLSPNEAKIYLSLIKTGERGASGISTQTGIHRRNVYDSLNRLLDKGLVQKSLNSKESKFAPVDPIKLKELLLEKSLELESELPGLIKEFALTRPEQQSFILRGTEGMRIIWDILLKEKQDIYSIGAKGQWFDPMLVDARKKFLENIAKNNITINLLRDYNFAQQEKDFLKKFQYPKIQSRVLPQEYNTDSSINICGDYTVQYNSVTILRIPTDTIFYVIKDRDLAKSYHKWFQFMWDMSK